MTVTEITNVIDMFKKFTMKTMRRDGQIKESDSVINISENEIINRLVDAMRYINRCVSPSFIRDWCLKCCRHLSATADLFQKQQQGPQRTRVLAKHVLENIYLDEREFLCMMCNAFDRQQIMQEIHDPDFRLKKKTMKDVDENEDQEYKFTIYQLDDNK